MGSFGQRLKQEREKRGITLDEIAQATKIGTRLLRALEEEKFDQLPGGIFNKGFVRAYARQLGMDEEQAVADYQEAAGENQPARQAEPVPVPSAETVWDDQGRQPGAGIPWGVIAALLLLVALGLSVWGFYSREKQAEELKHPAPRVPKTVTGPPAAASAPEPNVAAGVSGSPVSVSPGVRPAASATPQTPALGPAAGSFSVLIRAREDSWLSITADGKVVLEDMLVAPAERSVQAQQSILLKAGNVGGLEIYFNGKKLAAQGEPGEVKTLTFGAGGLQSPPPKPPS